MVKNGIINCGGDSMKSMILKTTKLTKRYGKKTILQNFDMTIKKGEIYALIGRNGAGKTTLIRLINGLASSTAGEIQLFEHVDKYKIQQNRKRIGTLIETPSLFLDKTAYENLNINRIQKGIKDKSSIDKVMQIVDLKDVEKKKVKNYSLGMKQRLGIAKALLGNPDFLILDEPINGLDPMGIIEMRNLFKNLNEKHEVTILICSHILKELSLIATAYGIIDNGKMIEEIGAKELKNRCENHVILEVNNMNKAIDILKSDLFINNFERTFENKIKILNSSKTSGEINTALVKKGIVVNEIMTEAEDVENYFSKVIGGESK